MEFRQSLANTLRTCICEQKWIQKKKKEEEKDSSQSRQKQVSLFSVAKRRTKRRRRKRYWGCLNSKPHSISKKCQILNIQLRVMWISVGNSRATRKLWEMMERTKEEKKGSKRKNEMVSFHWRACFIYTLSELMTVDQQSHGFPLSSL